MKSVLSVVLVTLALSGKGIDFNFDDILPLEKSVELAERGDAQGLYSLAINCAKGSTSREGDRGNLEWMRGSVWKLLTQAEAAGSADASLLLGALYERSFYNDTLGIGRVAAQKRQSGEYFDGKPKTELLVSSLPALETDVLTNSVFAGITPPKAQPVQSALAFQRPRTRGQMRVPEKVILVYYPDSKIAYRYNQSGLTNEEAKASVRAHYLKAKELGHFLADAALSHFETNCVRMTAIKEAKQMDATELAEVENAIKDAAKKQREAERAEQQELLLRIQEELRNARQSREREMASRLSNAGAANQTPPAQGVSSCPVAQKLQTCEFLQNGEFKHNAKFYLCLFSASWCGPCRAEMPRIAKMYVDVLKDDPDFELIHFSRDQNDEKALSWAKDHDVKFPVVKPNGGNPLALKTNGIPHLFVVKADGAIVEEGHPMSIFTLERLNEIRSGKLRPTAKPKMLAGEQAEEVGGYTWTFKVSNGEATIISAGGARRCTIQPQPKGDVVIPEMLGGAKVTQIGFEAFRKCSGMTAVTIPASVKEIGRRAFSECNSLTSVSIPSGVTKIYASAFSSCKSLKSFMVSDGNGHYVSRGGVLFDKDMKTLVSYPGGIAGAYEIPSGVTVIYSNAFSGCGGLTSVTVPDSVTSIGAFAFSGSEVLTSVVLGGGVKVLGQAPSSVVLSGGVKVLGQAPFYRCSGLTSITVNESNERYASRDGVLFDKDIKTVICCPGGLEGDYIIPSGVTTIGSDAFDSCRKLTSVTIPTSVTRINENAFNYCEGLKDVIIPSSVETIGDWAFCRAAESVTLAEGVKRIGVGAFCQCGELESVVIPASVTSIGKYAFCRCKNLSSVVFRGECPRVEGELFENCRNLSAIHVPSNCKSWSGMKEWQGIPLVFVVPRR